MGGGWRNVGKHGIECLNCLHQIVHRNVDLDDAANKGSKGSEEYIIATEERGILVMQWQKS